MSSLVLVANTRLPSTRAQALQVLYAGAAFARLGQRVTLLHAERADTPPVSREALFGRYGLDLGLELEAQALPCSDWIDRLPRKAQFVPARLQEWTFARNAAKNVRRWHVPDSPEDRVLCREIETAYALRGRPGLYLEIHRVPGGQWRRKWLLGAAKQASGVIAISGGVRDDLLELGVARERILVEHDAFDASRFENLPSRDEARAQLGLPLDQHVIVYTGGLLAWKGVELLVEAARTLAGTQVVIVGGMPQDVARIRALAHGLSHVHVKGFEAPARVPLYLAAADLGVVPNRSEPAISARYTSPLKIFEAMAVGLPLVVADLFSMRDILGPEEALFVKPDDGKALAEALKTLLREDDLRKKLGTSLGARASEHTFDARAQRILAWMRSRETP